MKAVETALIGLVWLAGVASAAADDDFERLVRPLLVQHCLECHGPAKQQAGLRLDSRTGWQTGGDSGPAIRPGKPEASLLIKAIKGEDGLTRMPPKARLSDREIAILTKWVQEGAVDPRDGGPAKLGGVTVAEAQKWWAFQPVQAPVVPGDGKTHAVDAFLSARLAERNLSLAPAADKRTLIRRVTYDLTGLPPTDAEVQAFMNDASLKAFETVVERLLASPQYGERWGRHWLDLVRYADTAGENSDHPLPHAWRYRNWVIDAFNRDQPYDEFLREQIAGDILAAQGPPEQFAPRVIATGFLAMARRFGHDSDQSMYLTHEDGIDTLGKALLGLTLGCARCHDHKYDAVTTRDYYALYGIFESTRFAFPGCEAKQQPRDLVSLVSPGEWERVVKPFQAKLAELDAAVKAAEAGRRKSAQDAQSAIHAGRQPISQGEISDGGEKSFSEAPVEIEVHAGDLILLSITPLKNHGADTTLVELQLSEVAGPKRRWNATEDLVTDLLAANPHSDRLGNEQIWWLFDTRNLLTLLPESLRDVGGKKGLVAWKNGDTPSVVVNSTPDEVAAWTKLAAQSLFVHPAPDGNVGLGWVSPISGKIAIQGRIKDAHPAAGTDGVGWVLERFAVDTRPLLAKLRPDTSSLAELQRQKAELLQSAPKQDVAYAVVEGKPADAQMHLRGDPEKLGEPVPRRWLEVLGGTPLTDPSASGRLELAGWITSPANPLSARVMVNRIWLHHFGKGLVKTPNDFGTRGTPPTHPELLDWLAAEFIRSNWSVKSLHRTILLSTAYQQSGDYRDAAAKADPTNDLYWRFERRRLSAEEIRDTLLATSGQLDRTPGGAHPFPPESSWGFSQHNPFGTFYDTDKRSVYLVQIRNRRQAFLGLFDGADPNATTPQRQSTTVPTQALYFLNDPFFHGQADMVADRVVAKPPAERLATLFHRALQREPTPGEREFADRFLVGYQASLGVPSAEAGKVAWSALVRVVLASNEFLFVE